MKHKPAHVAEYAAARAACGLLAALPHRAALALAWGPVRLAWALNGKLRAKTKRRLRQALGPEKSDRELERIGWLAFRNLAFTAVEGMRLPGIGREWVDRHMDLGEVDKVHEELGKGRGFIVAVPHMGNWELAGIALQSQGVNLMTLVRRQKNPLMDAWINRVRMGTGAEAIDTRSREVARVPQKLNEGNKVLAILPDVRAKAGGVRVRYLGVETEVPAGVAHYAHEADVPVYTGEVVRTGWARHGWRMTGRVAPDRGLPPAEDRRRILQYVMDRFGESVRAHPENYFWFNKRWVLGEEAKT
ncbi:MAG: lysophospholipid acyltransferase family protein [Kiritimatiellia bacterium]